MTEGHAERGGFGGRSAPESKTDRLDRRTLRNEVVVVLAVSAFVWAADALLRLAYVTLHTPARSTLAVTPLPRTFDPFAFVSQLLDNIITLGPVALVVHLVHRAGETLRGLGFEMRRRDVAFGAGLGAIGVALTVGGQAAARALGLPVHAVIPVNADASASYIVLFFVQASTAAVSEEVIVNAYLLHRLKQLEWAPGIALLASATLRATYHLYQGAQSFVPIFIGGLVLGRIYQRSGRITIAIAAHFTFDAVSFVGYRLLAKHVGWL